MKTYGDEEYIFYLSNLLLLEKREREKELVYIGEEKVNINDKKAFIEAVVRYMNEVIANDK